MLLKNYPKKIRPLQRLRTLVKLRDKVEKDLKSRESILMKKREKQPESLMSIEKVTQERLDIVTIKSELEEMRIFKRKVEFLSKQLGLYKDVNVINKELLKESLKKNVSNDFAKQQLRKIQGQNIIRKNVSAQLDGFKKLSVVKDI